MKNLTFGILVDSLKIKKWQYDAINEILSNTNFKLKLVVINTGVKNRNLRVTNFFFYLYKLIFIRSESLRRINLNRLGVNYNKLYVNPVQKGKFSQYFPEEYEKTLRNENLTFLLRFGFGILKGDVLTSAKYGIWSFHHGDEEKYRGGPYCFWEIYQNDPVTGAILQIITEKLDGGFVLKKGYFKTQAHSYRIIIEIALKKSASWPVQICKQIEMGVFKFPAVSSNTKAKIFRAPTNVQVFLFIVKIIANKIYYLHNKYFTYDFWKVGYIPKNIGEVLKNGINEKGVTWLNLEEYNSFLADPFLFPHNGKIGLAVEKYKYSEGVGTLAFYGGFPNDIKELYDFKLSEKHHLSFPNVFLDKNKLFCLPESNDAHQLFLYEKKKKGWNRHNLMNQLKCIDPVLIKHNKKYWLFTTLKNADHYSDLYIYYSNELTGPWESHALNPVVTDVRSARPAGNIFSIEGKMYRPGQNYSIHKEGSISISEIIKLSEHEYEEKIVKNLYPLQNSNFKDKIHTINSFGEYTIIDCAKIKKTLFNPTVIWGYIRGKLGLK